MKIQEIYRKFNLPPNLQEHMLRVCGVVRFIEQHWVGEDQVDWQLAQQAALLHDLGNIVKFHLDETPEFLGKEQSRLEYWKNVQQEIIREYGSDDHAATKKMLTEIGASEDLVAIILSKTFGNVLLTKKSDNWPLKIMFYGDMRALPLRIGTLAERMEDTRQRMPHYTSRPDFEDLVAACLDIEKQIEKNLDVPVSAINNDSIPIDTKFLELEI